MLKFSFVGIFFGTGRVKSLLLDLINKNVVKLSCKSPVQGTWPAILPSIRLALSYDLMTSTKFLYLLNHSMKFICSYFFSNVSERLEGRPTNNRAEIHVSVTGQALSPIFLHKVDFA